MYKIVIEDLTFKAILGLLEKERREEQLIVVNLEIEYEDKKNYVDYAKVCDLIVDIIQKGEFLLIEDAVDEVEKELVNNFPQMKSLKLSIKKPEILKNALVGVEILRKF
jgi:dihydroneopterin aldolase